MTQRSSSIDGAKVVRLSQPIWEALSAGGAPSHFGRSGIDQCGHNSRMESRLGAMLAIEKKTSDANFGRFAVQTRSLPRNGSARPPVRFLQCNQLCDSSVLCRDSEGEPSHAKSRCELTHGGNPMRSLSFLLGVIVFTVLFVAGCSSDDETAKAKTVNSAVSERYDADDDETEDASAFSDESESTNVDEWETTDEDSNDDSKAADTTDEDGALDEDDDVLDEFRRYRSAR